MLPDGSGIRIGGWTISSKSGHIATDAKAEEFKSEIGVLTIPEQWYDSSYLQITHEATGTSLAFTGEDALRAWRSHQIQPVQVPLSHKWTESRKVEMEAHHAKQLQYDWTYTTDYAGTTTTSKTAASSQNTTREGPLIWEPTSDQMDRTLLTSRDPILLFDDVLLYESELEDNGISTLSVKIRVMPKCWYVLLRFFLRVDGLLVRLREARLFSQFSGSNSTIKDDSTESQTKKEAVVLREIKYQEGTFKELRAGGAPPEGPAYADGDTTAVALQAVAPVGVKKYFIEKLIL